MKAHSKTDQLNVLFKEWQKNAPEYNVWDGVINEDLYKGANTKILFIAKEPNNPEQTAGDFREWWKNDIKYAFSYRIAEWSYGILNDFPEYDEIWKNKGTAHSTIQQIAFMNIKKVGGGGNANFDQLMDHAKKNTDYIQQEIGIIDPEIIILGNFWKGLRSVLFPNLEWKNSGYDRAIAKYQKSKIINFYHPSSRNAPSASYSLLQNIIRSKAFKKL